MSRLTFLEKYEELVLTATTILFTLAYSFQIIFIPVGIIDAACELIIIGAWAIFAIDYLWNIIVASNRKQWVLRHLPELFIVAVPTLRAFRLLRLLSLLVVIQKLGGGKLRGKIVTYIIGTTTMIIFISSLAILDLERNAPNTTITTFGDAVWWAIVTITTVGYGDLTPVTSGGRIVAVFLMISGISLLGTVTATLASWIVEKVSVETSKESDEATARIENELQELKRLIIESKTPLP